MASRIKRSISGGATSGGFRVNISNYDPDNNFIIKEVRDVAVVLNLIKSTQTAKALARRRELKLIDFVRNKRTLTWPELSQLILDMHSHFHAIPIDSVPLEIRHDWRERLNTLQTFVDVVNDSETGIDAIYDDDFDKPFIFTDLHAEDVETNFRQEAKELIYLETARAMGVEMAKKIKEKLDSMFFDRLFEVLESSEFTQATTTSSMITPMAHSNLGNNVGTSGTKFFVTLNGASSGASNVIGAPAAGVASIKDEDDYLLSEDSNIAPMSFAAAPAPAPAPVPSDPLVADTSDTKFTITLNGAGGAVSTTTTPKPRFTRNNTVPPPTTNASSNNNNNNNVTFQVTLGNINNGKNTTSAGISTASLRRAAANTARSSVRQTPPPRRSTTPPQPKGNNNDVTFTVTMDSAGIKPLSITTKKFAAAQQQQQSSAVAKTEGGLYTTSYLRKKRIPLGEQKQPQQRAPIKSRLSVTPPVRRANGGFDVKSVVNKHRKDSISNLRGIGSGDGSGIKITVRNDGAA